MIPPRLSTIFVSLLTASIPFSTCTADDEALNRSVEELRHAVGRWEVVTKFLNDDGSVADAVPGTYEFEWVVTDRVLRGQSEMPERNQSTGILFYVNEKRQVIEMAAVGPDGHLWIMTGELGGKTRYSQSFPTADGKQAQLRFTQSNVTPDGFDSHMEYSEDDGESWRPMNRQVFRRKK